MSFLLAASRRGGVGAMRRAVTSRTVALPQMQQQPRQMSTLKTLYKYAFRSNITYVTYIIVGVVIVDAVYGSTMDALWDAMNRGKQYKDVDWSKFKSDDDEEEEEEE